MAFNYPYEKEGIIDRGGKPATLFEKRFVDENKAKDFLWSHIQRYVTGRLRYQDNKIPVYKNPAAKRIIRDIAYIISEETNDKFILNPPVYGDSYEWARIPLSYVSDNFLFKHIMTWALDIDLFVGTPFYGDIFYTTYVEHTLKHFNNTVIIPIPRDGIKNFHRVLQDLGYNPNIDIELANPLINTYHHSLVQIPEEHLNFARLCLPFKIEQTLDVETLKFVGKALYEEIPRNRNDYGNAWKERP